MSDLVEKAQKYIEHCMADLTGDDDILPFMTLRNAKDEIAFVGVMMPDGPDQKDVTGDIMTAICMVYRAVEATFASCCWMVVADNNSPEAVAGMLNVAPSQHPNRVESIFVAGIDTKGKSVMHTANIVRENNKVGVGLWSNFEGDDAIHMVGGRFGNAIKMGIGLGQQLPEEMCAFIDEKFEAGKMTELIQRTAKMVTEARLEHEK